MPPVSARRKQNECPYGYYKLKSVRHGQQLEFKPQRHGEVNFINTTKMNWSSIYFQIFHKNWYSLKYSRICVMKTIMHCLSSVYFVNQPLHVSGVFVAHHQEVYYIYRVSQEEWTKLRESVPYVKIYRYNPKHLYQKLNGYGDNGQRSLKVWQLLHTYWLPNSY